MRIPVVSLSNFDKNFLQDLVQRLNGSFRSIRFDHKGRMPLPEEAYNSFRDQYKAERILDALRDEGIVIAVMKEGLYADGANYAFGESEYRGPAVVSTHRLRPEFYDEEADSEVLMERLKKEIIHEMGHCYGLKDCDNRWCVMHYSNSIKAVDIKDPEFCEECQVKISTQGLGLE